MFNQLKIAVVASTVFFSTLVSSAFATEASPFGLWIMADGRVTVRVYECRSALCGKIAALKEPISKIDGMPKVDRKNPKPALRKRPLIGLSVITGMTSEGEGTWAGEIYNPEDGKRYSANMTLHGRNQMNVRACVGGILCKTNYLRRLN